MSSVPPEILTPTPGDRGLASADPAGLGAAAVAAWDMLIACTADLDPDAPTRVAGASVRNELIPLGSWPDSRKLSNILHDAEAERTWGPADDDARKRLLVTHASVSAHELTISLQTARDDLADWLAGNPQWPVSDWGLREACSPVGPLPILTLLHGMAYEIAKTALDLEPAGCQPASNLLGIGLTALIDMLGAFTARARVAGSLIAIGSDLNVGQGVGRARPLRQRPDSGCAHTSPARYHRRPRVGSTAVHQGRTSGHRPHRTRETAASARAGAGRTGRGGSGPNRQDAGIRLGSPVETATMGQELGREWYLLLRRTPHV